MEEFNPASEEAVVASSSAISAESNPHSGKKKFRDYLSEGLMIFVAVVLGFLAENVRESVGNHEKEKEYIKSYLGNLVEDSSRLDEAIRNNSQKIVYLDSLMFLATKDFSTPANRVNLYRYFYYAGLYWEFMNNDATFLQLTNSGGLRIIKKDHVADSIAEYAAALKIIYAVQEVYVQSIASTMDVGQQIFDFSVLCDTSYYKNQQFANRFIPLISDDHQKMKILFNKIFFQRQTSQSYVNNLTNLKFILSGLIQYLKNEYPE